MRPGMMKKSNVMTLVVNAQFSPPVSETFSVLDWLVRDGLILVPLQPRFIRLRERSVSKVRPTTGFTFGLPSKRSRFANWSGRGPSDSFYF